MPIPSLIGQHPALRPAPCRLTVQDVAQALGAEQVLQTGHLVLQVPDQLVVGVLVDHRVALDVLGAVGVAVEEQRGGGVRRAHILTGGRENEEEPDRLN